MPVTPTGMLRHSYLLKLMVANCATFQSVTGSANATAALDRIAVPAVVEGNEIQWPRAVITETREFSTRKIGNGTWQYSGRLHLSFEFIVPSGTADRDDFENSLYHINNNVGAIIAEMQALSGTGEPVSGITHLNVTEITLVDGPWYQPIAEMADLELPSESTPFTAWWVVYEVGFF